MRVAVLAVAVVICLGAAGCSSGGGDDNGSVAKAPPSGLDTTSSAAAPSSAATDPNAIISKRIGQQAGLGCSTNQKNCADDLDFTVTDISPASGCSEAPPAGKEFLHIAASASMSPDVPEDRQVNVGSLLNIAEWGVIGADGYTSTNLGVGTSCTYTPGQFYDTMRPGTKQRGDIVFIVPEGAKTLILTPKTMRGGWQWDIPQS